MRDLKGDLGMLELIKGMNLPVKLAKFKEFFSEEWLKQAIAEKERADKAEYVCKMYYVEYALSCSVDELIECEPPLNFDDWMEMKLSKAREVLGDSE